MLQPTNKCFICKCYRLAISIFLISTLLNACSYSARTSSSILTASKNASYDLVVVPGVPLENGKWSRTMKRRVYWAKYLFDNGIARNVMFSGSAVYTPYYEGIAMAQYAVAIGIPPKNVFYETRAEHSTENIYYSYLKAKEFGFGKIALASDPYQTKLLSRFTRRRVSPDVAMLPMVNDTINKMASSMIDPVIDIEKAYKSDFVSLRKRQNFFKRLKGTLGYNIKDSFAK